MALTIYLDESGDLGWNFAAPYRTGGSSRYLTIASVCVQPAKRHLPKRLVKNLYHRFRWNPKSEKKWVDLTQAQRGAFAQCALALCKDHPDISLHSITVKKENVMAHIRQDGNKLYNYMIRLSLLDSMAKHDTVTMIPDPRSIKVESGNSLPDYLQIELWFKKNANTILRMHPLESHTCVNLQFADMLAGLVQSCHEDNEPECLKVLAPKIRQCRLYFGAPASAAPVAPQ